MLVDDKGFKVTAIREACDLMAYLDDTRGGDNFSLGFGSQVYHLEDGTTRPVVRGDTCTLEQALAWLRIACDTRSAGISKALKVPIAQDHFNALHDLYYQAGSDPLHAVLDLFNAHKPWQAVNEFAKWPFGQDRKPTEGHARRRAMEIAMCQGYYPDLSTFLLFNTETPRGTVGVKTPFPN